MVSYKTDASPYTLILREYMKKIKLFITALMLTLFLSSCGGWLSWDDISNPDAPFLYYYWKTCPHCIEMNKHLTDNDIYSLNIIDKKEVWNNPNNAKEFQDLVNNQWIPRESQAVPFFFDKETKKHYVWVANIIPILDKYIEDNNLKISQ